MEERFAEVIRAGGVVVFPADTVYGLACDPGNPEAIERLYALKGRRPDKPSALMVFSAADLRRCRRGWSAWCRARSRCCSRERTGRWASASQRRTCRPTVLQSSANHSGEPDARTLAEIPADIRDGADLVIDGGELPGTPSTVIDFTGAEPWRIVREGALPSRRGRP